MSDGDFPAQWRRNPYFVLGLATTATRPEIERAGQRLLGLLAIGQASAAQYETPLGPAERDADAVRAALAALRDPAERVQHTLWAELAPSVPPGTGQEDEVEEPDPPDPTRLPEARRLLGWKWPWPATWHG
jgi:curved DNA-binding protein CbpA